MIHAKLCLTGSVACFGAANMIFYDMGIVAAVILSLIAGGLLGEALLRWKS